MNTIQSYPASAALAGATSQLLTLGDTLHHETGVLGGTAYGGTSAVLFCATCPCFVRGGAAPVVATDGTDPYIPANTMVRLEGLKTTDKLSIACVTGTGVAYITPV